ncbi:hypothetical protein AAKU55_004407 [Oxalobacteraceae bacterium GrIS 1.11]
MLRQVICTAVLGSCALAGNAQAGTWDFSYVGFVNASSGQFDPNVRLDGTFIANDSDGNGAIGKSELTSLILDGQEYIGCGGSLYFQCSIGNFSYTPGGLLNYTTSYHGTDEESASWYGYTATGIGFGLAAINNQGQVYSMDYRWSPSTVFSITSSVPEPLPLAMFGIGLLGMAGTQLRRRREAGPAARAAQHFM